MSNKNQKKDKAKEELSNGERSRREKTLRESHIETLDILEEMSTLFARFLEFHIYRYTNFNCRILVFLVHN